jgi:hypothetical protein
MSRGPGRWQREILVMLERYPAFYLHDLLPLEPTREQQAARGRAVRALYDGGKISIARWLHRNPAGGLAVVYRKGTLAPRPEDIPRLSARGEADQCNVYNGRVICSIRYEERQNDADRKRQAELEREQLADWEFATSEDLPALTAPQLLALWGWRRAGSESSSLRSTHGQSEIDLFKQPAPIFYASPAF